MKQAFLWIAALSLAASPLAAVADHHQEAEGGHGDAGDWVSLFNGEDLTGWRINETPETFRVVDGVLVVHGPRSHAFYVGEVAGADFKNFEWECEIMTKPGANSGMYFHTEYQDEGWPAVGHEAQVNATHRDPRKTGGLYGVADVVDAAPHKDNEWFTQRVTVRGKRVTITVNGVVTTDYTEPEDVQPPRDRPRRLVNHGTLAIQGHDPDSEVHYRSIRARLLPAD